MTRRIDPGTAATVAAATFATSTAVLAVLYAGAVGAGPDLGPGQITPPAGSSLACDAGYQANDDMTGCEPLPTTTDPYDVARGDVSVSSWEGFTVGEVIVCPEGWTVSVDDTDDGGRWAACM